MMLEDPEETYPDDVYGDSDGDIVDEDDITESDLENADGESPWQETRPSSVWSKHPAMTQPRCVAAATCDEMKRLWVVGGGSSLYQGAETYGELEFLEAGGTEWRRAGVLAEPRGGHALARDARAPPLFLVGGYRGGLSYQKTVDAHDMRTGASHRLPDMRDHRSGPGAACGPDGCLYVVGGSPNGQRMLAAASGTTRARGRGTRSPTSSRRAATSRPPSPSTASCTPPAAAARALAIPSTPSRCTSRRPTSGARSRRWRAALEPLARPRPLSSGSKERYLYRRSLMHLPHLLLLRVLLGDGAGLRVGAAVLLRFFCVASTVSLTAAAFLIDLGTCL